MTLARPQWELYLWGFARVRDLLKLVDEVLAQMSDYAEHMRHGGDPAETRRDRWIRVEDVKDRYLGRK